MTNQITRRKSFVLHNDSLEILEELSDDQSGKLFKAIRYYQKTGNLKDVDQLTRIIASPFIAQFVRDEEKHQDSVVQGKLGNLKKYHNNIYLKVIAQELTIEEGELLAYPEKSIKLGMRRPPITPDQVGSLSVSVSKSVSKSKSISKSVTKKYSPEVEELTNGLKFVLEPKLNKQINSRSWANEIRKLIEIDLKVRPNAVDDVKKAIQAVSDNYGEKYFPAIQSASSLREKFHKVEAYLGRLQSFKPQGNESIYSNLTKKFDNE